MANWGTYLKHQSKPDHQALLVSFSPYLLQVMAGILNALP